MSHTLGIDLSTRPSCTGVCVLEWSDRRARVAGLTHVGYDSNDALTDLIENVRPAKVAIDAPFGWPMPFTQALSIYTRDGRWPAGDRMATVFRETDRNVRVATRVNPLSVAAEKLAHPAIRCADLLTALADPEPVDRTGAGLCAEVYPAAALDRWELLPRTSYRNGTEAAVTREQLVTSLRHRAPWLEIEEQIPELTRSDHLVDALICAILARALLGRPALTEPIPPELQRSAAKEGWIHLPVPDALERLG
jgi:predicted nuclease with RNAse H fold